MATDEPLPTETQPEDFAEIFAEQPDLTRLLWTLKRARGFALYFARCNVPAYRQKLMDALAATLPRPVVQVAFKPLAETENPFDRPAIDATVSEAIKDSATNAVIFVMGLENLLPSREPEVMAKTLQEINWRRSAFQRIERPLVFWLPDYALTAMAQQAPDLYDWYSGVYELDVPQRLRTDIARSTLQTIHEKQDTRWLAQDERHRWAEVLKELLEQAEKQDAATSETAPDQVALLTQLGLFYRQQGQYDLAQRYAERALQIETLTFGAENERIAICLNNLANIQMDAGNFDLAQSQAERAFKIAQRFWGVSDPRTASIISTLAIALKNLGETKQALSLAEQALQIDEAHFGNEHPKIIVRLNNLASIHYELGHLIEAQRFNERALTIAESAYDNRHPAIATSLNNLAYILIDLGQLETAKKLAERALAIDELSLGVEHPNVAANLNLLAGIYQKLGDLHSSKSIYERALTIAEKTLGYNHPNVAVALNNLANVLTDLNELKSAKMLYQRALTINRQALGDKHQSTQLALRNLTALQNSKPKGKKRTPPKQKKRKRSK